MNINDKMQIVKEDDGQRNSITRIAVLFGFIFFTMIFACQAYKTSFTWKEFLVYPCGVVILLLPKDALKALKIWKAGECKKPDTQGGQE